MSNEKASPSATSLPKVNSMREALYLIASAPENRWHSREWMREVAKLGLAASETKPSEAEIQLQAWHRVFETSQLSHAHARLQAAEEKLARLSAIVRGAWIPVTERLPKGYGEVLVAHPRLSNNAAEMYGVAVRCESTVRLWMSDKSDDSMHDAFWMPMPKGPA